MMGRRDSAKASLNFQEPQLLEATLEWFITCLADTSSTGLDVREKPVVVVPH